MSNGILGIHHVTAITGDPQQNVDFYAGLLGLRLIKVTVNFDMPETYHLYYGDAFGSPGTILTFFSWLGARRGRIGAGQVTTTSFSVPADSLGYWTERLTSRGVAFAGPTTRFSEELVELTDPDGLRLELIAAPTSAAAAPGSWDGATVPAERAIRGFHSVTILASRFDPTLALLEGPLGFAPVVEHGNRARFAAGPAGPGQYVDVVRASGEPPGHVSVGTVHHIAWRTPTDEQELSWRERLSEVGFEVTPVRDRQYFHSIYFVEPSGVLFEIATDPPGFATDETIDQLGSSLKLPPWLEPRRAELEAILPPIQRPT